MMSVAESEEFGLNCLALLNDWSNTRCCVEYVGIIMRRPSVCVSYTYKTPLRRNKTPMYSFPSLITYSSCYGRKGQNHREFLSTAVSKTQNFLQIIQRKSGWS